MKQKTIDFRELLESVLPLDDLLPADRAEVRRALQGGITRELETAALYALSRLEQRGALRRVPSVEDAAPSLRYEQRDALGLITVPLPATLPEGIARHHRAGLPAQARASLEQVRRLLDMDDQILFADPRRGDVRRALTGWLAQAGREFLKGSMVAFAPGEETAPPGAFDGDLWARAVSDDGAVFYCPDAARVPALALAARAHGIRSIAIAGVRPAGHKAYGCIEVLRADRDAFDPEDLAFVALLADYAAGVLERAERIEKLMFMDPMTAVYNRSYFELQLQNEMFRSRRESESMALCIVDIDDFKAFNTAYGYEAGNQVLTGVARALRSGVRPFDTVSRWGGEEFAVLLTSPVQAEDARTICERLRTLVGRLGLEVIGLDRAKHPVQVTVSMGVAVFPDHGLTPADLWRSANQALLVAKQPPKNQVVFFSGSANPAKS
jgi:diguanylate cyclase (GGDEF)-like protein